MLERLYVNNYRCLENFELVTKDQSSILLIGNNGVGKSTVASVLELFQRIARGANRVREPVAEPDFARERTSLPMRFRIEVKLRGILFLYELAFELPARFKELRVLDEQLNADGKPIFTRRLAQVNLPQRISDDENRVPQFSVDWHVVALPVIQVRDEEDPVSIFRAWASRMVILAPVPTEMTGIGVGETLEPLRDASNIAAWYKGILSRTPSVYSVMKAYLKKIFADFSDMKNEVVGIDAKSLLLRFVLSGEMFGLKLGHLSDGEKCLFLSAVVLAAQKSSDDLFCFWDEPGNYLSLSEVGQLVMELRRAFASQGQIIVTSHHPETIRKFTGENTVVLTRRSHLEPTQARSLADITYHGDLINSMILGDFFDGSE
jgi:ABC-type Mn2+/Zn2+ transport system ATPase subunit